MEEEVIVEEQKQPEKLKNVFRYKNFTLAWLGALVSNLGNTLTNKLKKGNSIK